MAWVDEQNGTGDGGFEGDEWYVQAFDWLMSQFGGSPGQQCAQLMTWRQRYGCTLQLAGGSCPGAPDPRRAALAAQRDPAGARAVRDRLANPINDGLAPTVAEMQDPTLAILWVHAVMGGWDCISRTDPSLPADVIAWIEATVPEWPPPGGVPTPPIGAGFALPAWWPIGAAVVLFLVFSGRS